MNLSQLCSFIVHSLISRFSRRDEHSSRSREKRRRSRSPVIHRRIFSDTLEGSLGSTSTANGGLPLPSSLPPTSLMGSLLASAKAKQEQEAAAAVAEAKANMARLAAAARAPATGSMTAIANAAADMIKAARNGPLGFGAEGALVVDDNMDKKEAQRRLDIEMQKVGSLSLSDVLIL